MGGGEGADAALRDPEGKCRPGALRRAAGSRTVLKGHGPHPTLRAGGQEGLSAEGAPQQVLKNKVQ